MLSARGAQESDVDFTLTLRLVSVEQNNVDAAAGTSTSVGTRVESVADTPMIASQGMVETLEDSQSKVDVTPSFGADTDGSDVLRKAVVGPVLSGTQSAFVTFSGLSSSLSTWVSGFYTVTMGGTGLASGIAIGGLSVSGAVECDHDFSLSTRVVAVEENGKYAVDSIVAEVGVAVSSAADVPALASPPKLDALEDHLIGLLLTPSSSADTDLSEALRTGYVAASAPISLAFDVAVLDAGTTDGMSYTVTSLIANGFDPARAIDELSVVGSPECDLDYTLYLQLTSIEVNGKDAAISLTHTTGVAVAAVSDTPAAAVSPVSEVEEDHAATLSLTPIGGDDTDLSDALRRATISPLSVNALSAISLGVPNATMHQLSETFDGVTYTLESHAGSGFASMGQIDIASVLGASQCDVDFTLTCVVLTVEHNGADTSASAPVSSAVVLESLSDVPLLASETTLTAEDTTTSFRITPAQGIDTDYSDALRKVVVNGVLPNGMPSVVLENASSDTVNLVSAHAYTVTSLGASGFGSGELLAGQSLRPAAECDVDFSLSVRVLSVEENGKSSMASLRVSSAVVVEAVTDTPALSAATSIETYEDESVPLYITPYIGDDTDMSDSLRQVVLDTTVMSGSSQPSAITDAGASLGMPHTMTSMEATGFTWGAAVSSVSIRGSSECDSDFTLSVYTLAVELNGQATSASTSQSTGVWVAAVSDTPTLLATSATDTNEDTAALLELTPADGSDTDLSDLLRELVVEAVVPHGINSLTFNTTTATLLLNDDVLVFSMEGQTGFGPGERVAGLSVVGAGDCDVDFTMSLAVRSKENNGMGWPHASEPLQEGVLASSSTVSVGVHVLAAPDAPAVDATATAMTNEDVPVGLSVTPIAGRDTDGSDVLRKLTISGVVPNGLAQLTVNVSVVATSQLSIASDNGGEVYTLSSVLSNGFTGSRAIEGLHVADAANSDIDFTLSVTIMAVEENGKVGAESTSNSIGVAVSAVADVPGLTVSAEETTVEDMWVALSLSPKTGEDTDLSDALRKLYVSSSVSPIDSGSGVSFQSGAAGTTMEQRGEHVYTLTSLSATGFSASLAIASQSVLAAAECDSDFTLGIRVAAIEENGHSESRSPEESIGVSVHALSDPPVVKTAAGLLATTEDSLVQLELTPGFGADTDSSDALRKLVLASTVSSFSSSLGDMVQSPTDAVFTLSATGSGFATGELVVGLQVLLPQNCDADFTFSAVLVAVEENGKHSSPSELASVGVQVLAISDTPQVSVQSPESASEDVSFSPTIIPATSGDTDASERLNKLYIDCALASVQAVITISNTADDTTAISGESRYTLSASSTGFESGAVVPNQAVLPAGDSDVDFTLFIRVVSTEKNGLDAKESAVEAIGVTVEALADQPGVGAETAVEAMEDAMAALALTPLPSGDTDSSDLLRKVQVDGAVPNGMVSLSFLSSDTLEASSDSAVFTLTATGSGFAPSVSVGLSVQSGPECDVDFTLSVSTIGVEENGKSQRGSVRATIGVGLHAAADKPGLDAVTSVGTTEDSPTQLAWTPWSGGDSDLSEALRKLYVRAARPQGLAAISFVGDVADATAVSDGDVYTMTSTPRTGFASGIHLPSQSILPAPQCDSDFTLSAAVLSVEQNGKSTAASMTVSSGIAVLAMGDEPGLELTGETVVLEDARFALVLTPTASHDTDGSEPVLLVGVNGVPAGVSFLPVWSTESVLAGSVYTLLSDSSDGFAIEDAVPSFSLYPADSCDVDFVLSAFVTSIEQNGEIATVSSVQTTQVAVAAVVDPVYVSVPASATLGPESVLHTELHVTLSDTDGSEAVEFVVIEGLPAEYSLSLGSQSYAGGVAISAPLAVSGVSEASLGMSIDAPLTFEDDFTLTLSAVALEQADENYAWSESSTMAVDVIPVYDPCELHLHDCDLNATCAHVGGGEYSCTCNLGFEGDGFVCADVDECVEETHACPENADCVNALGSYSCVCHSGYFGNGLECTACAPDAWSPWGSVVAADCECNAGYDGDGTTSCGDVDECSVGSHNCNIDAECENSVGSFTCGCQNDFWGDGVDCAACASHASSSGGVSASDCVCDEGYSGDGSVSCKDVNECATGAHTCDTNAACTNEAGGYSCACNAGYSGAGDSCVNIVECDVGTHNCDVNAACADSDGSFTCTCFEGFDGDGLSCVNTQAGSLLSVANCTADGAGVEGGFPAGDTASFNVYARDQLGTRVLVEDAVFEGSVVLEDAGSQHVAISYLGNGVYGGSYGLTYIGKSRVVQVSVTSEGVHIAGSPFTFEALPAATSASACNFTYVDSSNVELLSGGEVIAGASITAIVAAVDSFGNAVLGTSDYFEVRVGSDSTGWGTLALGNGTYAATLAIYYSGTYSLSISYCASTACEKIPESVLEVTITSGPTDLSKSVVSGTGLASQDAGTEVTVTVATRDAYGNPTYDTSDSFVAVVSMVDASYEASFTLALAELYHETSYTLPASGAASLVVSSVDGYILHESTFEVASGAPSAANSNIDEPSLSESVLVGSSFEVTVYIRDENDYLVSAATTVSVALYATQESQTSVRSSNVIWMGSGMFVASVSVLKSGVYSVSVTVAGQHVSNSGIFVTALPLEAYPTSCFASDYPNVVSATTSSAEGIPITLKSRDVYGNDAASPASFAVVLSDACASGVANVDGNEAVVFTTVAGSCSVAVLLDGQHIAGSPLTIAIEAGSPSAVSTTTTVSSSLPSAGHSEYVDVSVFDSYSNPVTVLGEEVLVSFLADGTSTAEAYRFYSSASSISSTHQVSFMLTKVGSYTMYVEVVSVPVAVKYVTVVASDVHPLSCYMDAVATEVTAGSLASFYVYLQDEYSNPIQADAEDQYAISATLVRDDAVMEVASVSWNDVALSYECSFTLTIAGVYVPNVLVEGSLTNDSSSLSITVFADAMDLSATHVYGDGLRGGIQGESMPVFVQLQDAYENKLEGAGDHLVLGLLYRLDADGSVADQSQWQFEYSGVDAGLYEGAYTVFDLVESTTFMLEVSVDDTVAPFEATFVVEPSLDNLALSANTTVLDVPSPTTAGVLSSLTVTPSTATGQSLAGTGCLNGTQGNLNVTIADSSGYHVMVDGELECIRNGAEYRIDFQVDKAGSYTVHATYRTSSDTTPTNIVNSPSVLEVVPAAVDPASSALVLLSTDVAAAPATFEFAISLADSFGNDIGATSSTAGQIVVVAGNDVFPVVVVEASYRVDVVLTVAGISPVIAYVDLVELQGSGTSVEVEPGEPDWALTTISGNDTWVAGEAVYLSTDLYDAFENHIPVTDSSYLGFDVYSTSEQISASVESGGIIFALSTTAGSYALSVGTDSTYSPEFYFVVTAAEGRAVHTYVTASVAGSQPITAGETVTVAVNVHDQFGNPVPPDVAASGVIATAHHDATTAVIVDSYLSGGVATLVFSGSDEATASILYSLSTTPPGTYFVSVSWMGDMSPSTLNVTAVPKDVILPIGAVISDSFSTITVSFSGETNRARQSGSFACDKVLSAETVLLLGEQPSCAFRSDSKLVIFPGFGWTYSLSDDLVHLLNDTIYARNENNWPSFGSVVVDPPANPMAPEAVLDGPAEVGGCSDLEFLDLTSSVTVPGSRQFRFGVVSTPLPADDDLRAFLSGVSRSTISVSASLMANAGTYVFNGTVTDSLGQQSTAEAVVIKSGSPSPLVQLARAKLTVASNERLYLKTTVSLPSCATSADMSWQWVQDWTDANLNAPVIPAISDATSKNLVLDPNTLTAGYDYIFYVTGVMASNPSLRGSDSVVVSVTYPSVSVSIAGGSRTVSGSSDLTLEATACDPVNPTLECYPDRPATENPPLFSYYWSCSPDSMCTDPQLQSLLVDDASNITIPAASLLEGVYQFTVDVVHPVGLREATAVVSISVSPPSSGVIDVVIASSADISKPVSTSSKLSLTTSVGAEVPSGLGYEWYCDDGDLAAIGSDVVDPSKVLTSPYDDILVIAANVLTPGQTYTLTVVVSGSGSESGSASVSFTANSPPTSGTLSVDVVGTETDSTSAIVASVDDVFLLTADGWLASDQASSSMLSYTFGFFQGTTADGNAGAEVVLVETLATVAKVDLPAGTSPDNTLTVFVEVSDTYGSTSRREQTLQVLPAYFSSVEDSAEATTACIETSVATSEDVGDTEAAQTSIALCENYLLDAWLLEDDNVTRRNDAFASDARVDVREDLVEYFVYLVEEHPPAVVNSATVSNALAVANFLSHAPDQLSSSAVTELSVLLADLLSIETTAYVGGLSAATGAVAVSTIAYLREAGITDDDLNNLLITLSESLLWDQQCNEAGVTTNAKDQGVYMSVARLSQSDSLTNADVPYLSLEPAPSSPVDCSSVVLAARTGDGFAAAGSVALASMAVLVGTELSETDLATEYWYVTIPREDAPLLGTAPMCVYLVGDEWVYNNETCFVVSASSDWVQVAVTSATLTVAVQDVDDPCLDATSCLQCNMRERCGWCASTESCMLGTATLPYYESACPADDWSFESCPCSAYSGCSACVSSTDGTGRTKQECGWCPSNRRCLAGDENGPDGTTCPEYDGPWTYGYDARCDLMNECDMSLHDCHVLATCVDTADYYECTCNVGYTGDGYTCDHSFKAASVEVLAPASVDVTQSYTVFVDVLNCDDCGLFDIATTWSVSGAASAEIYTAISEANADSTMTLSIPELTMEGDVEFTATTCVDSICHSSSAVVEFVSCLSISWESSTAVNGMSPRDRELKLTAKAKSFCEDTSVSFVYTWESASWDTTGNYVPSLTIPAYALNATQTYDISLTACVGLTADCKVVETSVLVTHSALVVDISTADGVQKLSNGLTVDASSSHDPDNEVLDVKWSCVDDTGAICYESLLGTYNSLQLIIPSADAVPGAYEFTLVVSTADGRNAGDACFVEMVDGSPPGVSAAGPSGKVVVSEKVKLSAAVDGSTGYVIKWTQVYDQSDPDAHVLDLLSPTIVLTSTSAVNFVLAPNVLHHGTRYRFRVTVNDTNGSGWSEVAFTTNRPPFNGGFVVSPLSGYALDTVFLLNATNDWTDDDAADYPFTYQFLYVDPALGSLMQLKATTASSLSMTLPGGDSSNGTLSLFLSVSDYYGADSELINFNITVYWPELEDDDVSDYASGYLDSSANDALQTGSGDDLASVVDQTSALLNSAVTDSEGSRRKLSNNEATSRAKLRGDLLGYTRAALDIYDEDGTSTSDLTRVSLSMRSVCGSPTEFKDDTKDTAISMVEDTVSILGSLSAAGTTQYSLGATMAATLGDMLTVVPEDAVAGLASSASAVQSVDRIGALILRGSVAEEPASVISNNNMVVAADILEGDAAALLPESSANASSVSSVTTTYASDPYNSAQLSSEVEVAGNVISQSLFDGTEALEVSASSTPAIIMIPLNSLEHSQDTAQSCTYWDGHMWSSQGCVRLPELIPPGVYARWVDGFDYSNSSRLQQAWHLELLSLSYPTCYEDHFVAPDGTILKDFKAIHEMYRCDLAYADNSSCYWDASTQRFLGSSCLPPDDTELECRCNHLTTFTSIISPPDVHILSISDFSALQHVDKLATTLGSFAGGFTFMVVLSLVLNRRYKRLKREAVSRLCSPEAGFRIEANPLCWTWSLEAFRQDDGRMSGSLVYVCEVLKFPLPRALFLTPSYRYEYENMEAYDKNLPNSQFVGTCLVLAFMETRAMLDRETLAHLRNNARRYFASQLHASGRFDMDHVIQMMKLAIFEMAFDRGWGKKLRIVRLALLQSQHGDWLPSLDVLDCLRVPVSGKQFELQDWINQRIPLLQAKREYEAYVAAHQASLYRVIRKEAVRAERALEEDQQRKHSVDLSRLHVGSPSGSPRGRPQPNPSPRRLHPGKHGSPRSARRAGASARVGPGADGQVDVKEIMYSPKIGAVTPPRSPVMRSLDIPCQTTSPRSSICSTVDGPQTQAAQPQPSPHSPGQTISRPVLLKHNPQVALLSSTRGVAETTRARALQKAGIELWDPERELMKYCPPKLIPKSSYASKLWATALVVSYLKKQENSVMVQSWRGEDTTQSVGEYWLNMVTGDPALVGEVLLHATKYVEEWTSSYVSAMLKKVREAHKRRKAKKKAQKEKKKAAKAAGGEKASDTEGGVSEGTEGGVSEGPAGLGSSEKKNPASDGTKEPKKKKRSLWQFTMFAFGQFVSYAVRKMEDFHPAFKALFMGSGTTISPVPLLLTMACHFVTLFMVFIWFYYSRSIKCCDW
eukprot:Rmarinus@m.22865